MDQTNEQPTTVEAPATETATTVVLPTVTALVKNAFSFTFARYDLALWYLLVSIFVIAVIGVGAVGLFFGLSDGSAEIVAVSIIVFAISLLVAVGLGIANAGALLFSATSLTPVTYKTGFAWVKANFWPFVWIQLLVGIIVMGGFVLFIVPAVIVAGFLSLAQLVVVHEGLRGTDALTRSWQLIRGHWWAVFWRMLVMGVVVGIIGGILGGVFTVMATVPGMEYAEILEITGAVVENLVGAFLTVAVMHAMGAVYHSLVAQKPGFSPEPVWLYRVLAYIGILVPVIGIGAALILASLHNAQHSANDAWEQFEAQQKSLEAELEAEFGSNWREDLDTDLDF